MTFERRYADALRADDPVAALRALADDATLDDDDRAALGALDEDGVRMTALLVAKLRFERLLRGDLDAARWFDRDPAAFTAAFARHHRDVAPTARDPAGEARLWAVHVGVAPTT